MPRKARKLSSSGVYHIMTRGIDKTRVMLDDADCIQFLCFLNFVQGESFQVLAYCLMGNHVHLLIKTDKANMDALELAMKRLLVRYVAYYNRKYDRVGGLFQNRYVSQPVVTTGYFLRVLRYIHNNPVAAKITEKQEQYEWSSYKDYFGERKTCLCEVQTQYALRVRPLEWLKKWHEESELNPASFSDVNMSKTKVSDDIAMQLIQNRGGISAIQVRNLSDADKTILFERLVNEERLGFSQLSRLTGIAKGEIKRLLLPKENDL